MISHEPLLPWLDPLRAEVPGVELLDAHTHLGENDPDGFGCSARELSRALEAIDARAVTFPLHEPGGYPPANDRVIAEAGASGGRLTAFCRVDPGDDPVAEARRCVDAGARGIKLHPRAEGFSFDHPALEGLFALAHERRLPVLAHAGRGIPALGRHAAEACERFPGMRLILAHAGISDLAWIHRVELPNLFFDTSWWSPSDLLALFSLVPPGRILMGSDAPYGTPAWAAVMALRCSLQVGLGADRARAVAGAQLARLLAGEEPLELGPPAGTASLPTDPLLDRVHTFLVSAVGQMLKGLDASETLALAALACEVGEEAPQAPVCRAVLSLLNRRARGVPEDGRRPPRQAPGLELVVLAAGIARTPDAPLPPAPEPADLSEREAGRA